MYNIFNCDVKMCSLLFVLLRPTPPAGVHTSYHQHHHRALFILARPPTPQLKESLLPSIFSLFADPLFFTFFHQDRSFILTLILTKISAPILYALLLFLHRNFYDRDRGGCGRANGLRENFIFTRVWRVFFSFHSMKIGAVIRVNCPLTLSDRLFFYYCSPKFKPEDLSTRAYL